MGGGGQKAFMSPAVIPFMFSLTLGLDSSQEVGTNSREGCGSGLSPPGALCSAVEAGSSQLFQQPQRLYRWARVCLSRAGVGSLGEAGADRNWEGRIARFLWGQHMFETNQNENVIRWCLVFVLKEKFRTCDLCSRAHAWMQSFWVYGKCGQPHKWVLKNSYRAIPVQGSQVCSEAPEIMQNNTESACNNKLQYSLLYSWNSLLSCHEEAVNFCSYLICDLSCVTPRVRLDVCGHHHDYKDTVLCNYSRMCLKHFSRISIQKAHLKVGWKIITCNTAENTVKRILILSPPALRTHYLVWLENENSRRNRISQKHTRHLQMWNTNFHSELVNNRFNLGVIH